MRSLLFVLFATLSLPFGSRAQSTAFTYQGRLNDEGVPATGTYDFEFTLWDSLSGGNAASPSVLGTLGGVAVSNGLFTVIVDFGTGALTGAPRWIQLGVRTNGSIAEFVIVTPRQAVPVVPYAVFATTASNVVAGGIGNSALAANAVTVDKIAEAAVVKGINNLKDAVTIQAGSNLVVSTTGNTITLSGTTGPAWGLNGNTGIGTTAFLGTTDQKAVDFRVGGVRALRLEPSPSGQPNVIGGHTNNAVAAGVVSAVIAGGGGPASGGSNYVGASYGSIGGGRRNSIQANSDSAVLGGGDANTIRSNSPLAVLSGGVGNIIESSSYGVIGGGAYNLVQAAQSSVIGGYNNLIQSNAINSAILSGGNNLISNNATYAVIAGGDRNLIGPGSSHANVAGGLKNTNLAVRSTIGGGYLNTILSNVFDSVISGGRENAIRANMSYGTIGGGLRNTLQTGAAYSSVIGGLENVIQTNSTVGAIVGGYQNVIQTNVSGGLIVGGSHHVISNNANYATIVGGDMNAVGGSYGLAAGYRAKAIHSGSFVWSDPTGGDLATTGTNQFLIRASGGVGIGTASPASLLHVLGTVTATNFVGSGAGLTNLNFVAGRTLSGTFTGNGAGLTNLSVPVGSLVGTLGTAQIPDLNAGKITAGKLADERLSTNVAFLTGAPTFSGPVTAPAFNYSSDRNLKQSFRLVDGHALIEKLAAVPISRWVYRDDPTNEHIGPMAQDFYKAFGLGADERHISAVDANGIALAAIQILIERLRAKDAEMSDLRQRIERLEKTSGVPARGK